MTLDEFRRTNFVNRLPPSSRQPDSRTPLPDCGGTRKATGRERAQQDEGVEGAWVHAYLHRKEGDQSNAAYWYNRAGKPVCREPLDAEWLSIVTALIKVT